MSQPGVIDELGTLFDNIVELRIPADVAQLAVPRTVAETVALRRDLDLDTVADIKLATDEACASLIEVALPHSTLTCRFEIVGESLLAAFCTTVAGSGMPESRGFGWYVLEMLTDTVSTTQAPYDPARGGYATMIEFTRTGNRVPA